MAPQPHRHHPPADEVWRVSITDSSSGLHGLVVEVLISKPLPAGTRLTNTSLGNLCLGGYSSYWATPDG